MPSGNLVKDEGIFCYFDSHFSHILLVMLVEEATSLKVE
jgi:hypothetical protein